MIQKEHELFDFLTLGQLLSLIPMHASYTEDCKIVHQLQSKIGIGFHYTEGTDIDSLCVHIIHFYF